MLPGEKRLSLERIAVAPQLLRRGRGEAGCGAGYAVLECSPSPVAWAKLVEAACDVSYSVLLDLFGKFVLEFWLFCIRRPQCLHWSR